ncbi:nitrile-specifier protein 5-like [Mizuhopecten yessoensis]|uniref:Nitrile-specifier protein 5 n=1 Tax=Mizuhopecten yessoensis TaxID=6573 RepID=A0A210PKR7_MIZYE|nr:nitrile-specifier protein 5-like [Mizuhopecten yessoensis]OWF37075.1 Nitrile-specifier protein 5 [Mizuhopecten yessoensis]
MECEWIKIEAKGEVPLGRSSHSTVVIGRKAFVFGGENTPRVPISNIVHCLNMDTKTWSELTTSGDVPIPLNAHSAAAVGHVMYVFGGRTGITMGEGSLNDLYAFDTSNNVWSLLKTSGDVPAARSFHAMTANAGRLYVFGGCGVEGRMNDFHSYDIATNTWEKQPTNDDIEGRGGAGLIAVGNDVFVVGGFAGREMNDVHRYDTVNKTWSRLMTDKELPPRSVFGITSISTFILVWFGEVDPSDLGHSGAGGFSKDGYVMNTVSKTGWELMTCASETPEARGWMNVSPCNWNGRDGMFLFGGNNVDNERLNDCYFLSIKL